MNLRGARKNASELEIAAFLVSEGAGYITGTNLRVDGGMGPFAWYRDLIKANALPG